MAIALYRRYRPETFAEMIGQTQVTDPLMTALESSKLGHAYLFSGPRGCGKTTSARILARCLNCHRGPSAAPCGECASCTELGRDGGGSLDVIEIDAASHGGVEDARDLRERAIFAPARDRFKIFIIDEAHMVSREGFNALLKIVEEPPEHVKFIFATTEPEKVIGTIRSRTHHYPFRLVAPAPLLEYTSQICEQEEIEAEDGVLALAVRAGGGSVRDTLSILDQLIAGSEGNRIAYDRAVGLLGYTPEDLLDTTVQAFADKDASATINSIDSVIQSGQDPRRFVEDLLERLRDLIIVQATDVAGAGAVLRGLSEEQLARLFKQALNFDRRELSRTADIVSETLDRMLGATAPKLQLELMAVRVLVASEDPPRQTTGNATEKTQTKNDPPHERPAMNRSSGTAPEPKDPQSNAEEPVEYAPVASASPAVKTDAQISFSEAASSARAFLAGKTQPQPSKNDLFSVEELKLHWPQIKLGLQRDNPKALEALKQIRIMAFSENNLVIGYQEKTHLEEFKQLVATPLRNLITQIFGVNFTYLPRQLETLQPDEMSSNGDVPEPEPEYMPESVPGIEEVLEPEPMPEIEDIPAPDYEKEVIEQFEPEQESSIPEDQRPVLEAEIPNEVEEHPEIIRYGESVVRAQLGAKFVKEIPLTNTSEE